LPGYLPELVRPGLPVTIAWMSPQKLYLDTSVIGGYHDTEWMAETRLLWQQAEAGHWRLMTSIVAEREV
jgi:hypothetical protein